VSTSIPTTKSLRSTTCLALSNSAEDFEFEYRMIDSSGETIWVHDIIKCEHRDGKPAELRGFMLDISERKRAEGSAARERRAYKSSCKHAGLGLWVWDATLDETWITPEGPRLVRLGRIEPVNLERFVRTLHPDDREPTRRAVLRSLQGGSDYVAEYRVVLSGGGDPLDCDARADRVSAGTAARFGCVACPLTSRSARRPKKRCGRARLAFTPWPMQRP